MQVRKIDYQKLEDRATRLLESGRLRQAERILCGLLKQDPQSVPAHFHLARVYTRMKSYSKALSHAQEVMRCNPNEPNVNLNLAIIYESLEKYTLAFRHYEAELLQNPDNVETLWNAGRLYFKKKRWKKASQLLRRCFDIGYLFEIEDTLYKLGYCFFKLKDSRSYVEIYRRYLQMVPDCGWAAANLGCRLFSLKHYHGAAYWLSIAQQVGTKASVRNELARARRMASKGVINKN